jgi:hypothetical protein
MPSGA